MSGLPVAAFDASRYIGTVSQVRPTTLEVNFPRASAMSSSHFAGFDVQAGQVGEFVLVEGEQHAVLGRVIEVRLPERERLLVEPSAETEGSPNPIGTVQLLTAIDLNTGSALKGVPVFPRIGQHVFSAHPQIVKRAVEAGTLAENRKVQLAEFPYSPNTSFALDPSHIFGRHCAVLGATGGGKSWTLATLVEEIARLNGKAILFDATGEFETQADAQHVYLGGQPDGPNDPRRFVSFPYTHLTESDLFVIFRPSPNAQAPKLREALRSLKIASLAPHLAQGGLIRKAGRPRAPFEALVQQHAAQLATPGAQFDINLLPQQIQEECVWPTAQGVQAATHWGLVATNEAAYCTGLVARIEADITSAHMRCVFQPQGLDSLPQVVHDFLEDPHVRVLRVSMEFLPFEHNARELVANAVGRYLLSLGRSGRFKECPLVAILDEAHQFLDKTLGDEFSRTPLEAFGLIAKEGRKYFLTCVLATQRPRDIPEDVLSQLGMFVVHRLINERDRHVVEKACGNMDAAAAAFLPTLAQGEAIVVGVDSPMPLPVLVRPPRHRPKSHGPDYEAHWQPPA